MLTTVLIVLAIVIVGVVIVVSLQPADFRIERSATISAPASSVFEQVIDFHSWAAWSPWENMDPALVRTYEGPSAGVGAMYSWVGNKNVGQGRMTIVESRPHELIRIKLEFLKPFKATNATEFTFAPQGDQTRINWAMSGRNNPVSKLFCMFMNMDKMVGGQFEKGLTQLKAVAEGSAG